MFTWCGTLRWQYSYSTVTKENSTTVCVMHVKIMYVCTWFRYVIWRRDKRLLQNKSLPWCWQNWKRLLKHTWRQKLSIVLSQYVCCHWCFFSAAFYSCIFCVSVVLASVRLSSEYIIFNRYWYTNFYCNVCCESHWTLSGFVHHPLLLLCPAWVAKYCNEWVCLSPHITRKPCGWISPNFLFKLPVAVALFSSDGVAMCYVLTVLWMTSSFHIPRDQWTEIQYFGTSSLVCTNVITSL